MYATLKALRYSEKASITLDDPPGFLLVQVRGVGFEPTEAFARGS